MAYRKIIFTSTRSEQQNTTGSLEISHKIKIISSSQKFSPLAQLKKFIFRNQKKICLYTKRNHFNVKRIAGLTWQKGMTRYRYRTNLELNQLVEIWRNGFRWNSKRNERLEYFPAIINKTEMQSDLTWNNVGLDISISLFRSAASAFLQLIIIQ